MPHSLSHLDHIPCPVTWYSTPASMGPISMSLWCCMTCSIWDIPFGSRLLSHDMTFRPCPSGTWRFWQWDLVPCPSSQWTFGPCPSSQWTLFPVPHLSGPHSLSLISVDLWFLSLISVDLVPCPSSQWTLAPLASFRVRGPLSAQNRNLCSIKSKMEYGSMWLILGVK